MRMKRGIFPILVLWLLIGQARAQGFFVGTAQRNINPNGNILFMAGGKPNRPFTEVHDSLYVKAIVVSDGKTELAIITFDCIGLLYPELQKIRKLVKDKLPDFPTNQIVMSSTHSHAGPDVVGIWGKDLGHSGVNEAHMQLIVDRASNSIIEARKNKKKATLTYANGSYGEDWVKNISEPTELDREVSVLQFKDQQGKNLATITNFACHPTIMDDATTLASSDYVGGYYHYLDSLQGGNNMFLQGAIGGWVQPEDVPSSFENATKYGTDLAIFVINKLSKSSPVLGDKINFRSKVVYFPVMNEGFKMLSKGGVIKRAFTEKVESEIAYFSIGNAAFATHPGETVPALSHQTKALMKTTGPTFVMGLGMDALGYILKPSFFDPTQKIPHSEYLTGMSVGPETMQIIYTTLEELTKK